LLGCLVYFASLFLLKEIDSEVNTFLNWVKQRKAGG